MSLLLDALYKASKDKEKAAEMSLVPMDSSVTEAPVVATAGQAMAPQSARPQTLELELVAAEQAPSLTISAAPDLPFPSLELELEPDPVEIKEDIPPALQLRQEPLQIVQAPEPSPVPKQAVAPPAPAKALAPATYIEPEVAANGNKEAKKEEVKKVDQPVQTPAAVKQPGKIAQILSRTQQQSAAQKNKPNRRVLVLGGIALVMLLAVGGLYLSLVLDRNNAVVITEPPPPPQPAMPEVAAAPTEELITPAKPQELASNPATKPAVVEKVTATVTTLAAPVAKAVAEDKAPTPVREPELLLRPGGRKSVFVAKAAKPNALELGYVAMADGRFEDASKAYAQVLMANAYERDALMGMAYIAHQRGQREDALAYYQRVLRQDPANAIATAAVLTLDSQLEPAVASLRARDLAARQPDSVAALTTAANALVRDGQLAEAMPLFARAQRLEPDNALHAYNHAVALDRLGQVAQAIEQYKQVIKIAEQHLPTSVRPFSLETVRLRLSELNQSKAVTSEIPNDNTR